MVCSQRSFQPRGANRGTEGLNGSIFHEITVTSIKAKNFEPQRDENAVISLIKAAT